MARKYELKPDAEARVRTMAFQSRKGGTQLEIEITPDEAKVLLTNFNDLNRPLDQDTVIFYALQMLDGKWLANGEPIIISDQGNVLDGQHRLAACIEADIPFKTDVRTGVPEASFTTIDTGRKRSASNILNIYAKMTNQSIPNQSTVMSAAALCIEYLHNSIKKKGTGGTRVSSNDKLQFVIENPGLTYWVAEVKKYKGTYSSYSSPVGAVCFFGSRHFEKKAEAFAHGVMTGENLASGSPMLALRSRLPNTTKDKNPELLHRWQRFALVSLAWNCWVENQERQVLKLPQDNSVPQIRGTEDLPRARVEDIRRRLRGYNNG